MAAQCVVIDGSGYVVSVSVAVNDCTSFVLLDSSDWVSNSIWAIPPIADVSAIWALAFSLPMSIFLISWAIGSVVRMFKMR